MRATTRNARARIRACAAAVAAVAAAAGAGAGAATAAPVAVPNACYYGIDGYWRDLPLRFDGTASPQAVRPGAAFAVRGGSVGAELPAWIPQYGYNLGILRAGENTLPATVWVALKGTRTRGGAQVLRLAATATTTITTTPDGAYASATPISVTVPLPDTFWTAGAAGTASIAQAGAGTLGSVQLASGQTVSPRGSVLIEANLAGGLSFQLDCMPGAAGGGGTQFTPAAAAPFATLAVDPSAAASGIARTVSLPSAGVAVRAKRVRTAVRCTGATTCRGVLTVTTAKRVRLTAGGPAAFVTVARGRYTIAPGRTATLALAPTAGGRKLLATRASAAVTVRAAPAAGPAATRRAVLRNPAAASN